MDDDRDCPSMPPCPDESEPVPVPVRKDSIKAWASRPANRARGKTFSIKRLSKRALEAGRLANPDLDVPRPETRADCLQGVNAMRPCPFVSCKHHLYLDVSERSGAIKLNFPDLNVWEMNDTCSLDVADRKGVTLEEVGEVMNLTRERVRQLETRGTERLRILEATLRPLLDKNEVTRCIEPEREQRPPPKVKPVLMRFGTAPLPEARAKRTPPRRPRPDMDAVVPPPLPKPLPKPPPVPAPTAPPVAVAPPPAPVLPPPPPEKPTLDPEVARDLEMLTKAHGSLDVVVRAAGLPYGAMYELSKGLASPEVRAKLREAARLREEMDAFPITPRLAEPGAQRRAHAVLTAMIRGRGSMRNVAEHTKLPLTSLGALYRGVGTVITCEALLRTAVAEGIPREGHVPEQTPSADMPEKPLSQEQASAALAEADAVLVQEMLALAGGNLAVLGRVSRVPATELRLGLDGSTLTAFARTMLTGYELPAKLRAAARAASALALADQPASVAPTANEPEAKAAPESEPVPAMHAHAGRHRASPQRLAEANAALDGLVAAHGSLTAVATLVGVTKAGLSRLRMGMGGNETCDKVTAQAVREAPPVPTSVPIVLETVPQTASAPVPDVTMVVPRDLFMRIWRHMRSDGTAAAKDLSLELATVLAGAEE